MHDMNKISSLCSYPGLSPAQAPGLTPPAWYPRGGQEEEPLSCQPSTLPATQATRAARAARGNANSPHCTAALRKTPSPAQPWEPLVFAEP